MYGLHLLNPEEVAIKNRSETTCPLSHFCAFVSANSSVPANISGIAAVHPNVLNSNNLTFSYEYQTCFAPENCVDNAYCDNEGAQRGFTECQSYCCDGNFCNENGSFSGELSVGYFSGGTAFLNFVTPGAWTACKRGKKMERPRNLLDKNSFP